MTMLLSERKGVTARKPHRCCFCGERINVGEKYNYNTCVDGGDLYANHEHPECTEYAHANWDPDWEDDLSEPAFERPKKSP